MKYFSLINSSEVKEIGVNYPQVGNVINGFDINAKNSFYTVRFYSDKPVEPGTDINMDGLVLTKGSKKTDLLSVFDLSEGIMVSERMKNAIQKNLVLGPHTIYPAKLYGKEISNYYWFHFYMDKTIALDFTLSSFYEEHIFTKLRSLAFENKSDFMKYQKNKVDSAKWAALEKASFQLKSKYDIFNGYYTNAGILVSKKAKDLFEILQFTGIAYSDKIEIEVS
ncbi:MAG: hypothetical protein M0D57_01680 [Sphingobacteriales bacterium JAD_PAG50586_3]|nr:MAG: hypothetical protein M0D57_01680 [Sphingobacteriales bacterium JAD_PAG50586_3]